MKKTTTGIADHDKKHKRFFEDPYAMWKARMSGEKFDISPQYADTGFCGRWKLKRDRKGFYDRLAIWPDGPVAVLHKFNDERTVLTSGLPQIRGFAFAEAVSQDAYEYHEANGVWPGEVSGLIRNADSITDDDQLRENMVEVIRDAAQWLLRHPNITTQDDCDVAANYRTNINNLAKSAKARLTAEHEPLKLAIQRCKEKWAEVINPATKTAADLLSGAEAFLIKQDLEEKKNAAKALARITAERDEIAAFDIVMAALMPEPEVHVAKPSAGGQTGRKMGLKGSWHAVVDDHNAALLSFANHPKVIELITSLCQAEARSKTRNPIPGVRYVMKKKAM